MNLVDSNDPDAHLSISDVLESLRGEFPDITISKIRFLEGQGLLIPERTPSGYRKFSEEDLTRLRWILEQQRDHFLPLRVIKERLDNGTATNGTATNGTPSKQSSAGKPESESEKELINPVFVPTEVVSTAVATESEIRLEIFSGLPISAEEVVVPTEGDAEEKLGNLTYDDANPVAGFSRAEFIESVGITDEQLDELIEHGLISPLAGTGERSMFGSEALVVATLSTSFYQRGIEARHLKMYRHFADREGALFAQVLRPYLRQRNPESEERLEQELEELARLSRSLRTEMLRRALRDELTGK